MVQSPLKNFGQFIGTSTGQLQLRLDPEKYSIILLYAFVSWLVLFVNIEYYFVTIEPLANNNSA